MDVVQWVFAHKQAAAFKVFLRKGVEAVWQHEMGTEQVTDASAEVYYKFIVSSIRDMLTLVIKNTFIRFGAEQYFWQVLGIPMGINPGVFIANIYLLWFEYTFIGSLNTHFSATPELQPFPYHTLPPDSPLLDPATSPLRRPDGSMPLTTRDVVRAVLYNFAFTKRFVDDLKAVLNPLFPHLTYTSQSIGAVIHGIYDPRLNLKESAALNHIWPLHTAGSQ